MAPRLKIVLPDPEPPPRTISADEIAFVTFADRLIAGLGSNPAPHHVNVARLQLADRYYLIHSRSPKRLHRRLAECFISAYARLWDVKDQVEEPAMVKAVKKAPPKAEAYLPPEIRLPEE